MLLWMVTAFPVISAKQFRAREDMLRLLCEIAVFGSFAVLRLPGLVYMKRQGLAAVRCAEAGDPGAITQSAKLVLQAMRCTVGVSMISLVMYSVGLVNSMALPPCQAAQPGDGLALTCRAYFAACCSLAAANAGLLLCSAAMLSAEPRLRRREPARATGALPPERIGELPVHDFGDPTAPPTKLECPICLEDFAKGDMVRHLPCGHHFHARCVDAWLFQRAECPMRCTFDFWTPAAGNVDSEALGAEGFAERDGGYGEAGRRPHGLHASVFGQGSRLP